MGCGKVVMLARGVDVKIAVGRFPVRNAVHDGVWTVVAGDQMRTKVIVR